VVVGADALVPVEVTLEEFVCDEEPLLVVGGGPPAAASGDAAGREEAGAAALDPADPDEAELTPPLFAAAWNSAKVFVGGALIAKTIPCWQ